MDVSIKRCTCIGSLQEVPTCGDSVLLLDRLSSLPIELLIKILSLLPTKDAAATCLLSKRLRGVFPWITSLDFDDSSILFCLSRPSRVEHFPNYVTFVDNVLQEHKSQHLTRFRLQVGGQSRSKLPLLLDSRIKCCLYCVKDCFPHMSSTQIHPWISFPLTRHGLTELDLRIHVREQGDIQLPPAIFMCETLELLKLDVNLGLDLVLSMPSVRLPNLKKLHLVATFVPGDGLVTKLVSCCPVLEDLFVNAYYSHVHFIDISSSSLRRLHYSAKYLDDETDNPDIMLINTPNLEHLVYCDNLASHYTISKMDSLVTASIEIVYILVWERFEVSYQQLVNLIRPMSNAQHLSLLDGCAQDLNYAEFKDELPVFRSLTYLELDAIGYTYWNNVLLAFLNRSPVLESLVFPGGLDSYTMDKRSESNVLTKEEEMEHEFCITALEIIPWCCRFSLKRILVKKFMGTKREVELIQFLLKHALVLEELVISHLLGPSVESTLQNLPRASDRCSIKFQKIEPYIHFIRS